MMRDIVKEAFEVLEKNSPVFNKLPICEQESAATNYAATAEVCNVDVKEYSDRPDGIAASPDLEHGAAQGD